MDKRYQVFVSSTYSDLKKERQHVMQTLMEMDCIPAGMELFAAIDEEQWTFIQKVIDDCDYYLLIIGGRYGSITEEGISYTEKEFDYAIKKGLKVIALVHGDTDKIEFGRSEQDPELRKKLDLFRQKVMTGRLVKFWEKAEDLAGLVALSLVKIIKMYPAVGWIRANKITNEESLTELNQLRKENTELIQENTKLNVPKDTKIIDLADVDSIFTIHGKYSKWMGSYNDNRKWTIEISWKNIFLFISPYLLETPNDSTVKSKLVKSLKEQKKLSGDDFSINDQEFKTISIQLKAYRLVNIENLQTTKGGRALFWSLTEYGEQYMIENRVIKKEVNTNSED